jgi:predicted Zn-ribbon and HTH transcriptional regulator
MFLPDGANVRYAAEIKKHVKESYVATVGALSDPELMEEIIASGQADVVELARLSLPNRTCRSGAYRERAEIKKCMRCLQCFSNLMARQQFLCAINPVIGHEYENQFQLPPANGKKYLSPRRHRGHAGGADSLRAGPSGHPVREKRQAGARSYVRKGAV